MQTTKTSYCIALILCVIMFSPTILFGSTVYFDSDGNVVDKNQHEQITAEREKTLKQELKFGYPADSEDLKDPIKLRQRRIEQWKNMRSMYNPGSLPSKIESNPQSRQ